MTATANMPQLRFPEFSGEWVERNLGDLAIFLKGKSISKADIVDEGAIECIRYGELYTHYGEIITSVKSKTNMNPFDLVLSKFNDVIIPASGETQIDIATASCVLKDDVALGGDLNILRLSENGVFIAYYLNSKKKYEIAKLAQGNSVVHLYSSQLKTLVINLPSLPEQTKIAAFLSAVDTKIDQLTQKKALLETYKKGAMQQIFSQQIRFKADDGREYPEWEEKKLGEVAQVNPKSKSLPEEFYYIDLESVEKGKLLKTVLIERIDAPSRAQRLLQEGDIVFQMVRPYQGNNYFFNLQGVFVASTGYAQIRTDQNSKYLYQFLHTEDFVTNVINRCTGSSYPAINSNDLADISVHLPCIEEQTKIANFLSAIDRKIDLVSQQLDESKAFKKGLLQQMFV